MRYLSARALLGGILFVLPGLMVLGILHIQHEQRSEGPTDLTRWLHASAFQVRQEAESVYMYVKAPITKATTTLHEAKASLSQAEQTVRALDDIEPALRSTQLAMFGNVTAPYRSSALHAYAKAIDEHLASAHRTFTTLSRRVFAWQNQFIGAMRQSYKSLSLAGILLTTLLLARYTARHVIRRMASRRLPYPDATISCEPVGSSARQSENAPGRVDRL